MKKLLIATSLVAALAGCQSNNATVKEAQNFAPCTFPDAPTVSAPGWICDVIPSDIAAAAKGYSKKSAEQEAAKKILIKVHKELKLPVN